MFVRKEVVTRKHLHTTKSGRRFFKPRKCRMAHFVCDQCKVPFVKQIGKEVDIRRCNNTVSHFCRKCPAHALAAAKGQITHQKRNLKRVGQRDLTSHGYVSVYVSDTFPSRNVRNGRIFEHIYVMEQHIGRELRKGEVVHHIDGNKQNNDLNNLDLLTVQEHNKCHATIERVVFDLLRNGVVWYNRLTKRYEKR